MPSIVLYLVKCSISLAIVWLFYQLLLRKLTFYTMNRWYLLGYVMLSFLLPLIHVAFPGEESLTGNLQVIRYIPVITLERSVQTAHVSTYTGWDMLLMVLAAGMLLLLGRRLVSYWSLRRIQKNATLIRDTNVSIYEVDEPIIPFSFGNAIYINPQLHSEKEWEEIILHEYVHVRQRHTLDILAAELLCIVSWFNPFVWLIRLSIRQNLEFIADEQVLASGMDRKVYQYHLLKVVGEARYRLANNFNFSSLKKRIIMMNKSRSAKLHLVKFLFIVPMVGVLLVAFRDKVDIHLPENLFHKAAPAAAKAGLSSEVVIDNSVAIDTAGPRGDTAHPGAVMIKDLSRKDIDSIKPMFVIDEVEASEGAMKKMSPADISFINILKNSPDALTFGPRAIRGVVLIYTKAYAPNRKNEILLKDGKKVPLAVPDPPARVPMSPGQNTVRDTLKHVQFVRPASVDTGGVTSVNFSDTAGSDLRSLTSIQFVREALIILDGRPCAYEDLKTDPSSIESVSIIKSKAARAIYGPRAEKGVVLIVTKKSSSVRGQSLTIDTENERALTMKADSINFGNILGSH